MELLVLFFGVALVITVLIMFVRWLFSPAHKKNQNRRTALETALETADRGNPQEAIAIYTRLLQQQPDDATVLYMRAAAYQKCELYEEALADLNKAIELEEDGTFYATRALIYQTIERDIESLRDIDQAIKLEPKVDAYRATRGFALLNLGRRHEALQDFEYFMNSPAVNFDNGQTARLILTRLKFSDEGFKERVSKSLKSLQEQKDAGILTQEEFETLSVELMTKMLLD